MSLQHALIAARAAASKTSDDAIVLDVGEIIGITDHFVIASGRNDRQVRAVVDEVTKQVRDAGGPRPRQVEGLQAREWVLLDYGDFVVHVFGGEARQFYALERLWSDAPRVAWDAEPAGQGARA